MAKRKSKAVARRSQPVASESQKNSRVKLSLGDVIEFETSKGFAYAQYVYKHSRAQAYGELFRIVDGCFPNRVDLDTVVKRNASYVCFCRPYPELKTGIARIVSNAAIPVDAKTLPLFKWAFRNILTGKVIRWEIWDGKTRKGRPVEKLAESEKQYPLLETVTLDVVIARIEANWKPKDECSPEATSVFGDKRRRRP